MIILALRKILNRKAINGCLLLGIILFLGMLSGLPMLQNGSEDTILQKNFQTVLQEKKEYPARIGREVIDEQGETDYAQIEKEWNKHQKLWESRLKIPVLATEQHISFYGGSISEEYGGKTDVTGIGCVREMGQHIELLAGESLEEAEKHAAEGVIPIVITEQTMDQRNLVIGEHVEFPDLQDETGRALRVQVAGIIREKREDGLFWQRTLDGWENQFFVSEASMQKLLMYEGVESVYYEMYEALDYRSLSGENADDVAYALYEIKNKDKGFTENLLPVLKEFHGQKQMIDVILYVLVLPMGVLLFGFLYLVLSQMIHMEKGEIVLYQKRGYSKLQMIKLYGLQVLLLLAAGYLLSLPAGYLFGKIMAASEGFLQFRLKETGTYHWNIRMCVYPLIGIVIVLFLLFWLVYRAAAQKHGLKEKSFGSFQKAGGVISFGLMGVSLYLLYQYSRQRDTLAKDIMTGEKTDPFLFLDAMVFLFAVCFLLLCLVQGLIKLLYLVREKTWSPAVFSVLLQMLRAPKRQHFVSVFFMIILAMGVFQANIAGMLAVNEETRIQHNNGCDVRFMVQQIPQKYYDSKNHEVVLYYEEMDYAGLEKMLEKQTEHTTRVLRDDAVKVSSKEADATSQLMAIQTKDFGQTAELKNGLTGKHWYYYLNSLAKQRTGVLISKRLAQKLKCQKGDYIHITRNNPLYPEDNEKSTTVTLYVCDMFEAWPGHAGYSESYDEEGNWQEQEEYQLVMNYAYAREVFGESPCEIWAKTGKDTSGTAIRQVLEKEGVALDYFVSTKEEIQASKHQAMEQVTNGLFTLSFLLSMIIFALGYLIYWLLVIEGRGPVFGVFRGMGMHMREVIHMLFVEQFFQTVLPGVFGVLCGNLASTLFAKVEMVAYLPEKHDVPLLLYYDVSAMGRMGILLILIGGICVTVMCKKIKKENMLQAIKLGEDNA